MRFDRVPGEKFSPALKRRYCGQYGVHEEQAAIGTPALTFMAGQAGTAVRYLEVAAGGLQVGTGTRQVAAGKVIDGGLNIGAGLLGIWGAAGAQSQLTRSAKTIAGGSSGVNY